MNRRLFTLAIAVVAIALPLAAVADDDLPKVAAQALRRAADYLNDHVSCEGGYLWHYSADLTRREGENAATATQVWNQPPGTPAVGQTLLTAYERTGDKHYLDLARRTGMALVRGQLHSGGWDYRIEFDNALRDRVAYRVDGPIRNAKQFNTSTYDDNTTQSALRFLMALDERLEFQDKAIHESVEYALAKLIEAQYPNGAWPQRFSTPHDPAKFPVKKASYPATWSRTFENKKYLDHYTFNDSAMLDCVDVLFIAERIYEKPEYRAAAMKAGDFLLLAQLPEPQPTWAQQYDADMHPAWARKFEPPSVTGGESQVVMLMLLDFYRRTGEKRFLEPIPRALEWFKRSQLAKGTYARFYELQTNKPLYFTKKYELTYDDSDMPTHYGFKVGSRIERVEKGYSELTSKPWQASTPPKPPKYAKPSASQEAEVRQVIAALDSQGRWLVTGTLSEAELAKGDEPIIRTDVFMKNADVLSRYLAGGRGSDGGK